MSFALAAVSLLGAIFMATKGREGWAFVGTFLTIALAVAGLFVVLFPAVMPASNDPALSLMAGHNPAVGISAVFDDLHTHRDDVGGGDLHAHRVDLPGLDLLGSSASGSQLTTSRLWMCRRLCRPERTAQ